MRAFRRIETLAWWFAPAAFLFWLHGDGLRTWFMADDFAWLGLLRGVHNFHDLLEALFLPAAQGTIRPWSERGFFLLFESLFGLDSLPFRVCVFVTMAANAALVAWITRRITGSSAAGFLAPILWLANTALVTVMAWNSAFNEALCALFLLTATVLFIRYAETGRTVFWRWQLFVFVLGFGALEVNAVYPALAAAYALFVAAPDRKKQLLLSVLPLAILSVAYVAAHRALTPLPRAGPYAVHIDGRIFSTLRSYWTWSLLPKDWTAMGNTARSGEAIFWVCTLALAGFCFAELAKNRREVLYCASWFLITLTPMIFLPDHISDYYLSIPLGGLAMLGGFGVARALNGPWMMRAAAMVPLVSYLVCMMPSTRAASRWWLDQSIPVRDLVLGVQAAHERHPDKVIVLDRITASQYKNALAHSAFYPSGVDHVYLTPESRLSVRSGDDMPDLDSRVMSPAALRNGIDRGEIVIYSALGDHLRNTTALWRAKLPSGLVEEPPRVVDVSNPLVAHLLSPEWLAPESADGSSSFRWMPRRATLRIGGPRSSEDRLLLEGYCPARRAGSGPVHVSVTVDGIPLPNAEITEPERKFRHLFDVPPSVVGRRTIEIEISVDQVIRESNGRELGLVFGTISIGNEK